VKILITYNLKDEEILQTGKYKGFEFTKEKLKEIFDNFYKLKEEVKPTIKLGHGEQDILGRSGFPAAGYITDLKLSEDGERLYANLQDVPKEVKELIDAKAYNRKSAEVILSYEDPNKPENKGTVLCGLALLGEEMPEIKTLEDIKKMYYSDNTNKIELITLSTNNKEEVKMADVTKPTEDALTQMPVVTEQKPEKVEMADTTVPVEEVVNTVDMVVSQLEKVIESLYAFLEDTAEADDMMLSRAEKSVMKLAEGLKKKKKAAEVVVEKPIEKDVEMSEETVKMSDMENKIKMLEMEVEKSKQKAKDAEIEKLNFSDETYIENLVKEGKLLPVQKDDIKKLFCSINKKEANIIMLSDTEKVDIKETIKKFIESMPKQVDLSTSLTTNIAENEEKKPEEIQISKVKDMFPKSFKK
jgi:hypothetical protein